LPPPLRGTVNLARLMRSHPGWSGLGQYDDALSRLALAAAHLPAPGRADEALAVLPALPLTPLTTTAASGDTRQIGRRLNAVQNTLLDGLRGRREQARQAQLRQERELRVREANRMFLFSDGRMHTAPDLDLQLLRASIDSLSRTVAGWSQSAPPAPKLLALQRKVLADRARLEALVAERTRQREAAAAKGRLEVQNVLDARDRYVQARQDVLALRLAASTR